MYILNECIDRLTNKHFSDLLKIACTQSLNSDIEKLVILVSFQMLTGFLENNYFQKYVEYKIKFIHTKFLLLTFYEPR